MYLRVWVSDIYRRYMQILSIQFVTITWHNTLVPIIVFLTVSIDMILFENKHNCCLSSNVLLCCGAPYYIYFFECPNDLKMLFPHDSVIIAWVPYCLNIMVLKKLRSIKSKLTMSTELYCKKFFLNVSNPSIDWNKIKISA